jgi:uncharacterized protein YndB with AHSA1/START domain
VTAEAPDRAPTVGRDDRPPADVVSLHIAAPAQRLWELLSDITNMPRWSPETYRARWVGGATGPRVGARFKGYNRWHGIHWSTIVEVEAADPGREFTFTVVIGGERRTTWSYVFEATADGTRVTETRTPHSTTLFRGAFQRLFMRGHVEGFRDGMLITLQRLKAAAETQ